MKTDEPSFLRAPTFAKVAKFDPRRGTATVVTSSGKHLKVSWEVLQPHAAVLGPGVAVMLFTDKDGNVVKLKAA